MRRGMTGMSSRVVTSFNRKPEACALRVGERTDRPKRRRTNLRSVPGFGSNDAKALVNAGFVSMPLANPFQKTRCPRRDAPVIDVSGFRVEYSLPIAASRTHHSSNRDEPGAASLGQRTRLL